MIRRFLQRQILPMMAIAFVAAGCASSGPAKFNSPQAAVDSMVQALRFNDTHRLREIFGPESEEIVSSGDAVADQAQTARFVAAYDQKHDLQNDASGAATLIVGEKDWPFPVPIVQVKGKYIFDTPAGKDEILNRRIGRNELDAQQVCLAIVDAEREYVALRPMGGDLPLYARKILSDASTKDGVYWPTSAGEPPSPLGELVAQATEEGYRAARTTDGPPPPYHGYRYHLLTAQGPAARGGAMSYEVNGKLIGGFAVIAYPAQYGNSGIMTFCTNHDGVLYERDLGPQTEKLAPEIREFDPGPPWHAVNASTAAQTGGDSPAQ
jgi:hypothetical protein